MSTPKTLSILLLCLVAGKVLPAQKSYVQDFHPFLLPDSTLGISYRLLPPPEGYGYDLSLRLNFPDQPVQAVSRSSWVTSATGRLYWTAPPLAALRNSDAFTIELSATLREGGPAGHPDPWQEVVPRDYIFIDERTYERNPPREEGLRIYTNDKTSVLLDALDFIEVQNDPILGSPYLFDEAAEGTLTDQHGNTYFPVTFKYNIYHDQLEYLRDGQPVRLQPNTIATFTLFDPETVRQRRFRNGFPTDVNERLTPYSYFEILHDGEVKVLRHYAKLPVRKLDPSVHNYVVNEGEIYYSSRQESILLLRDGKYEKVNFTRGAILRLFDEQAGRIREMARRKNLRFNEIEDFLEMVRYYENDGK